MTVVAYPGARLSPGELDVLERLARGAPQKEVARERGVSIQTVKNQLSTIYRKTGATSLIEAYYRIGWLIPSRVYADARIQLDAITETIDAVEGQIAQVREKTDALRDKTLVELRDLLEARDALDADPPA